jgi:hypothetical protein
MAISGLSGSHSSSHTSQSQQAPNNPQDASLVFAQLIQDIQSGNLSGAQQDLKTYQQDDNTAPNPLASELTSALLSNNLSDAQADLTNALKASQQTNVNSFLSNNDGTSVVSSSYTDQATSTTFKLANGQDLTMSTFFTSPSQLEFFQATEGAMTSNNPEAQQVIQNAWKEYMVDGNSVTAAGLDADA